jgi:hypothetical protein
MRHVTLPLAALLCTLGAWGDNSATTLGSVLGVPPSVIALDPAGNIILAGTTSSFQLPVTNGSTTRFSRQLLRHGRDVSHGKLYRSNDQGLTSTGVNGGVLKVAPPP